MVHLVMWSIVNLIDFIGQLNYLMQELTIILIIDNVMYADIMLNTWNGLLTNYVFMI